MVHPSAFLHAPQHPRRAWAPASHKRSWKPYQTGKTKRDPCAFSGGRHWSRASQKRPIYSISMDEARCGGACPGKFVPVLMIGGKCSCFRAKPAHFSGQLPVISEKSVSHFVSISHASLLFSSRYRFSLCLREWVAVRRVAPGSCREMQEPNTVHGF